MKHHWILLSLFLLMAAHSHAQTGKADDTARTNLVHNGSFETYRSCPRKVDAVGILTIVEGWYQPTQGSADYFNRCGSKECGVPQNKLGNQPPRDGNGYCGIYCSKNNYREYLQTRLLRTLRTGDSIRLSYYVSLSEESTGAIATMGGLFTADRISDTVRSILLDKKRCQVAGLVNQTTSKPFQPQVMNPTDRLLDDTKGWQQIEGIFVAQGGERYITIGNFTPVEQSGFGMPDSLTQLLPGAYYYIDDVRVECLNCKAPETDESNIDSVYLTQQQSKFTVGSTYILNDILFEFDKSTMLQQSYSDLMRLYILLRKHPRMRIEIRGHTDSKGTDSYNQRLSEKRAQAVANYLIEKGIPERRIRYKGYGKSLPIDNNDTEEGRAKNRRVEFKILSL